MVTSSLYAAYATLTLALCAVAFSTLWSMLYAWRNPERSQETLLEAEPVPAEPRHSFSLIVPARHEERVLGATLARLMVLDHPSFEIVVVVGHDDEPTRRVADSFAAKSGGNVRTVVDYSWPKNKPKALNVGLGTCRGDVVGVFDAEDEVSLDLLRRVDASFGVDRADVVQAGVQLVTVSGNWFSLRNCLEYLFWFRSRLHAHASRGFVPLGGNTVFFRRELLVDAGGWDESCLAEDCEIGLRLSASQARFAVVFDPRLATREETPETIGAFVRQRTRWNQGYLQVLRKGHWRALPTRRQRALAWYVLVFPLLQAMAGVLIPLSVLMILLVKVPLLLALFGFVPLLTMLVVLGAELGALSELRRSFYLRTSRFDAVRLAVTLIPYQFVLAYAALRATAREIFGLRAWEKTAHVGAHREVAPALAAEA